MLVPYEEDELGSLKAYPMYLVELEIDETHKNEEWFYYVQTLVTKKQLKELATLNDCVSIEDVKRIHYFVPFEKVVEKFKKEEKKI